MLDQMEAMMAAEGYRGPFRAFVGKGAVFLGAGKRMVTCAAWDGCEAQLSARHQVCATYAEFSGHESARDTSSAA